MIIKIAEYKVKIDAINDVMKAVEVFMRAIKEHERNTFYEAFRKGDSLEFIHLMKFPNEASEKQHASASYTNEFVKVLYPNCEKEPVFTNLITIE